MTTNKANQKTDTPTDGPVSTQSEVKKGDVPTGNGLVDQPQKNENETSDDKLIELLELRLDYAWKWFDFHARQRTTIFNFFLLTVGLIANAIVQLLVNGQFMAAGLLSTSGLFISVVYFGLDIRNSELVHWGEDILCLLERRHLFPGDFKFNTTRLGNKKNKVHVGILYREYVSYYEHPSHQSKESSDYLGNSIGSFPSIPSGEFELSAKRGKTSNFLRHRVLFRTVIVLVGLLFLLSASFCFFPSLRESLKVNAEKHTSLTRPLL